MDEMRKESGATELLQEKKQLNADTVAGDQSAVQENLEKYDTESRYRRPDGFWGKAIKLICIVFSLFQFYTAGFGVLPARFSVPCTCSSRSADFPAVSFVRVVLQKDDALARRAAGRSCRFDDDLSCRQLRGDSVPRRAADDARPDLRGSGDSVHVRSGAPYRRPADRACRVGLRALRPFRQDHARLPRSSRFQLDAHRQSYVPDH